MSRFNGRELGFSITNTEEYTSDTSRDESQPFSFFDFIQYLKVEYAPEKYSPLYSQYLKVWYSLQDASTEVKKQRFKEFYKEFIRQVILNYTTQTEKLFLSKIDYSSSTDLDIAIPFYANRLTEIATFYRNKRESGKYIINEHKIKGSTYGIERAIFDSIYNFLANTDNITVQTSLSNVINDFGISVEEYVDVYGSYFDLPRETTNVNLSSLRNELYENNLLNIDSTFYTDPEAIEVLRSNSFISLIDDFTINSPAFTENDITSLCDPEGGLFEELNEIYTVGGLSLSDVYNLKRSLIAKYVSSDFYFINTSSSTGVVSGLLFEAEQPTSNLLNIQTGDMAAVESTQQQLLRETGLFFKPDDLGIFKLNAVNSSYEIDETGLVENQIYIFPDPNIYGNVGVNALSSYPFVYTFDYTENIRNISSGIAAGDPKITNKSLTFEPYSLKQRETQELTNLNDLGYRLNFSDLYNKGVIRKMAYDSYGNEYAMFKPEELDTIEVVEKDFILSLLLDGHSFFDEEYGEGFNFNYSAVECNESLKRRSGFTTETGTFNEYNNELYLHFREFTPYQELSGIQVCDGDDIENNLNIDNTVSGGLRGVWRDGGSFTTPDGDALPDSLKTTDFGYPGNGIYYYNILLDASIFEIDVRLLPGGATNYNAGRFGDINLKESVSDYGVGNYQFFNNIHTKNRSVISTLTSESGGEINADRILQSGDVFVKNQGSALSLPLSSTLRSTLDKYSTSIRSEITNNLKDFDVIDDSIFLQTPDKLIIDKINYNSKGEFVKPNTANTIFQTDPKDTLNVFSNRLYVNEIKTCNSQGAVLFAIFKQNKNDVYNNRLLPKNYSYVYPEIYQYDIQSNSTVKIFPIDLNSENTCIESFKTSYNGSVTNYAPEKVRTANIAYNSLQNKLKVSYIILDQNNFSHIHDALFKWSNGTLTLERLVRYNPDHLTIRTSTFNDSTTFAKVNVPSGNTKVNIDRDNNLLCIL